MYTWEEIADILLYPIRPMRELFIIDSKRLSSGDNMVDMEWPSL